MVSMTPGSAGITNTANHSGMLNRIQKAIFTAAASPVMMPAQAAVLTNGLIAGPIIPPHAARRSTRPRKTGNNCSVGVCKPRWGRTTCYHATKQCILADASFEPDAAPAVLHKRREQYRRCEQPSESFPRLRYVAGDERAPISQASPHPPFDLAPRARLMRHRCRQQRLGQFLASSFGAAQSLDQDRNVGASRDGFS
jgi:hypothetical protein